MRAVLLGLAVLALGPAEAGARCVTKDDLALGVLFQRDDGREGLALADGGTIRIDYDHLSATYVDKRRVVKGVFETGRSWFPVDEPVTGGGVTELVRDFSDLPPDALSPGMSWQTSVVERETIHNSSEQGMFTYENRYSVTYRALATRDARLSGCTYHIMPVEADWTYTGTGQRDGAFPAHQRWLYFPDLGLAIETLTEAGKNGLTKLRPAG